MERPSPPRCPHLAAAACALAVAAAFLAGVQTCVRWRLPKMLPFYAAHAVPIKIDGNLLQSAAFRVPGELPVYGSSELDNWVANRADAFFRHRPTGFAVFMVGRGGGNCLSILQKLAAAGPAACGKRVVIFLSPAWFVENDVEAAGLDADLGFPQLSAWVFDGGLRPSLKMTIARRMLNFPDKLKNQELLDAALRCLARRDAGGRCGFALLAPLGRFQNTLLESLESCAVLWEAAVPQHRYRREGRRDQPPPPVANGRIDWPQLEPAAGANLRVRDVAGPRQVFPLLMDVGDGVFLAKMARSQEFDDLALLMRVLREKRMEACFIGQPFNAAFRRLMGVSAVARRVYHARLETVLRAGGYPWRDFPEHEEDAAFFADAEHPSPRAWLLYNRVIDRFYSGEED